MGSSAKQIVDAPEWVRQRTQLMTSMLVPDGRASPTTNSGRAWPIETLADRFKLAFHREQAELSVYALTVAKRRTKKPLAKNESGGALPGLFFRPTPGGVMLPAVNSTMADFAGVMQTAVLDRPGGNS